MRKLAGIRTKAAVGLPGTDLALRNCRFTEAQCCRAWKIAEPKVGRAVNQSPALASTRPLRSARNSLRRPTAPCGSDHARDRPQGFLFFALRARLAVSLIRRINCFASKQSIFAGLAMERQACQLKAISAKGALRRIPSRRHAVARREPLANGNQILRKIFRRYSQNNISQSPSNTAVPCNNGA